MSGKMHGSVPVLLQMDELEGGAVCLNMVLSAWGKQVAEDRVRKACGVSRDGVRPQQLADAAASFGMECLVTDCTAEKLSGVTLPAILLWNRNQYVVLCEIRAGSATLNHPGKGQIRLPLSELEQAYAGTCLTCVPGKGFVADGKKKGVSDYLVSVVKENGSLMLLMTAAQILVAAVEILSPTLSRVFMDDIMKLHRDAWYPGFIRIFAALIVFQLLSALIQGVLTIRTTGKLAVLSNARYMRHILRLPMDFFAGRKVGDLARRQDTNDTVAETVVQRVIPVAMNTVTLVFYLIIMIRYSALLTGIGLATIILNYFVIRRIGKIRREIAGVQHKEQANLDSATVSGINMIETIKATGAENGYFERWSGYHASVIKASVRFNEVTRFLGALPSMIQKISDNVVLFVGCVFIIRGSFTAGMLVAFLQFAKAIMKPVNQLLDAGEEIQTMEAALDRVYDVMESPEESLLKEAGDALDYENAAKLSGRVEMNHVSFGYAGATAPLIEDFNLTLEPGKRVAFVGGSGSGKSTVAKMLAGLNRPWSGEILFDGKPIDSIPREVFKGSLAMVNQEIALFRDTAENNIRMWDESIEDFEVTLAAMDAGIHEMIMARKNGYRMMIRENGGNLSGGERQRIEIARVLASDPSILIMDEATSALDARTEYEISENIHNRGITCIIVAHRLSTVRDCDEILVFDNGKIVQRGTHDELMTQNGLYSELIRTA